MSVKGQDHSLNLVKGHSDFKVNTFFSQKQVGRFGPKIHMKAEVRMGMIIYTNELGHLTNMAAMPIYSKNLKKIFFSRSNRPMILKLGMLHCLCEYYQGCSDYDPGLTLTYFTSRSNLVT